MCVRVGWARERGRVCVCEGWVGQGEREGVCVCEGWVGQGEREGVCV